MKFLKFLLILTIKSLLPINLNIPNLRIPSFEIKRVDTSEGCLIIVSLVLSCIRLVVYPASKIKSLDILVVLSSQISDIVILDRVIPYLMTMTADDDASVKVAALEAITQIVSTQISNFSFFA